MKVVAETAERSTVGTVQLPGNVGLPELPQSPPDLDPCP